MAKVKDSASKDNEERGAAKEVKKSKKPVKTNSVSKSSSKPEKKDKKERAKRKALAEKALNEIHPSTTPAADVEMKEGDEEEEDGETVGAVREKKSGAARPLGALVPFANPLADEKVAKKMFKGVKKGTTSMPQQFQAWI
jgi:H/ACA ribonucleoprotein complex subunit 2